MKYHLLIVEDNPGDIRIMVEAIKLMNLEVKIDIFVVKNGIDAIRFLRKESGFEECPKPDLIFLDLNIPKWDGREVLGVLKTSKNIKQIPIIVISTSNSSIDIKKSYQLHANCFVNKKIPFDDFISDIQKIVDFWLFTVCLPSESLLKLNEI